MRFRRVAFALLAPLAGVAFAGLWFIAELNRFPNIFVMVLLGLAIALSRVSPRLALITVFVVLALSTVATAIFPASYRDQPTSWLHPMNSTDWPIYAAVIAVPALVAIWAKRPARRMSLIAAAIGGLWLGALVGAAPELPWNHGRLTWWVNLGLGNLGRSTIAFSLFLLLIGLLAWAIGWGIGGVVRFAQTLLRDPVIRVRINDAFGISRGEGPALTARERDVLLLVSDGKSNAEIAAALFLSETTVKSHLRSILSKLGLKSRTEIAAYAWKTGLVQLV